MTRSRLILIVLVLVAGTAVGWRELHTVSAMQQAPPGSRYEGRAFTFNKFADGVYLAIGTGALIVMSNAAIVEGDRDVLVVDSHVSPGGAWALRKELAEI